jgi:hypothetical protein
MEMRKLMDQYGCHRFEIGQIRVAGAFKQGLELERAVRDGRIFEIQARRQGWPVFRLPCRIEIKVDDTRDRRRLVPFGIFMAGGDESEFLSRVAEPRSPKTLDECLAVAAASFVVQAEKMKLRLKVKRYSFGTSRLYDFGRHAVPCDHATPKSMLRMELDKAITRGQRRSALQSKRLVSALPVFVDGKAVNARG